MFRVCATLTETIVVWMQGNARLKHVEHSGNSAAAGVRGSTMAASIFTTMSVFALALAGSTLAVQVICSSYMASSNPSATQVCTAGACCNLKFALRADGEGFVHCRQISLL